METTSNFFIPVLIQTSTQEDLVTFIPFNNPTNHPDVIWFNQTEPLTIDMSRVLAKEVLTKPYSEKYRVFILQNLELATIEAQQALLKLLEEPPAHIKFILTTSYPSMILSTILSRVQLEVVESSREEASGEIKENATELRDMSFKTLADRLNWAAKPEIQENPISTILNLISQQIRIFEKKPNAENTKKLKTLQTCLDFLRAKTNTKLSLEWLALHF